MGFCYGLLVNDFLNNRLAVKTCVRNNYASAENINTYAHNSVHMDKCIW